MKSCACEAIPLLNSLLNSMLFLRFEAERVFQALELIILLKLYSEPTSSGLAPAAM